MRNGADKIPERDYAVKTTVWFDDESRKVMVDPVAWEPRMIEDDDQAFISNVVRLLARYDDIDLVEVSRDPKGPWKRHYDGDPSSVMPKEEIRRYFRDHLESSALEGQEHRLPFLAAFPQQRIDQRQHIG